MDATTRRSLVWAAMVGLASLNPGHAALDPYLTHLGKVVAKYGGVESVPAPSVAFLMKTYGKSEAQLRADLARAAEPAAELAAAAPVDTPAAPPAPPPAPAAPPADEGEAEDEESSDEEAEEADPTQQDLFEALMKASKPAKPKVKRVKGPADGEVNEAEVTVGVRSIAGDEKSWVYNEYRDRQPGVFAPDMAISSRNASRTVKASGVNLGRDDQTVDLSIRHKDKAKVDVNWTEIPHNFVFGAPTIWQGIGGNRLSVEPGLRGALTGVSARPNTVGVNNNAADNLAQYNILTSAFAAGGLDTTDIGFVRQRGSINFENRLGAHTLGFRIDRDQRQGTRPMMFGFGFSYPLEMPMPIDYTTTDLTMDLRRDTRNASFQLSAFHSGFSNRNESLEFENPFRTQDGTVVGNVGIAALPADNTFKQWTLNAVFKNLGKDGRLNALYSWGEMDQHQPLLNLLSTNSVLMTTATQQAGLDQAVGAARVVQHKVRTTTKSLGYRVRPTRRTNLKANYKSYEYDNRSPVIHFNGGLHMGDGYSSINPAPNAEALGYWGRAETERPSYHQTNWDLGLSYDLNDKHNVALEWGKKEMERHHRELEHSVEDIWSLTFSGKPQRRWSYRATYKMSDRSADGYDYLQPFYGVTVNPPVGPQANNENPQLPWLRKYDEAARDRDEIGVALTFLPREDLSITASFKDWKDEYDESLFGLLSDERQLYGIDIDHRINKRLGFTGFYNHEKGSMSQSARQWNPGAPGVNDPYPPGQDLTPTSNGNWWGTNSEETDTFGASLEWTIKPDQWDASFGFSEAKNDGRWDFYSPIGTTANDTNPYIPLPMLAMDDVRDRQFRVGLRRKLRKDHSIAFGYVKEEFEYEDWNVGSGSTNPGVPYVPPSFSTSAGGVPNGVQAVLMNTLPQNFDVHNFYVAYTVKF